MFCLYNLFSYTLIVRPKYSTACKNSSLNRYSLEYFRNFFCFNFLPLCVGLCAAQSLPPSQAHSAQVQNYIFMASCGLHVITLAACPLSIELMKSLKASNDSNACEVSLSYLFHFLIYLFLLFVERSCISWIDMVN